ncbi:MAG: hypothetical protein OSP8Acid_02100 [uncultured Acidilobus sp. OSP8]|nr:MAG: hypothetical protein OSP8Acid_02100 [uncultured Acidilobus sp. OSP8]
MTPGASSLTLPLSSGLRESHGLDSGTRDLVSTMTARESPMSAPMASFPADVETPSLG